MTIYFYSTRGAYGAFSNFARYGVDLDDQWWSTVEHYFQGQKFHDSDYRERIRTAKTPKEAATLGRSREVPLREDWEQVKDAVKAKAVLRKFELHAEIRRVLLDTGEEPIVEDAPGDYYWGCGKDGSGRNQLGKILEEVRATLRSREAPSAA
ncbi:MAG: NADAR family protein, partial [Candidatus Competibacterales bacterium]